IVSAHAKLPAHLEQHGEATFQVRYRELARPWRELATMWVGALDLVIVAAEQPFRIVGIFQARAPNRDRLFVGHLEGDVRFAFRVIADPRFALEATPQRGAR